MAVRRNCQICGKRFYVVPSVVKNGGGKYCSRECLFESLRHRVMISCEVCGKEFETIPAKLKGGNGPLRKYCSKECCYIGRIKLQVVICEYCGREFEAYPSELKRGYSRFCSTVCRDKMLRGENHPNWRGGTSFAPYDADFTQVFKKAVRERDDHTCAICHKPGKHVHHIDYDKENTVLENCVTLCNSCHSKTNHKRVYWQLTLSTMLIGRY